MRCPNCGGPVRAEENASGGVTRQQAQLAAYLDRYISEKGYSPSYQEMADALGFRARSAAARLVDRLIDRGIVRKGNGSRSLQMVKFRRASDRS